MRLLTDGHALLVTPTGHHPDAGTVTQAPAAGRQLAGRWTGDPAVPVPTAAQLAAACARTDPAAPVNQPGHATSSGAHHGALPATPHTIERQGATPTMGTRGYVGRPDAIDPTPLHLRSVHSDAVAENMVSTIAAIHPDTFGGDTDATVTAPLARTWAYLGADVTAPGTFLTGDTTVTGVGRAIHATPTDPPATIAANRIEELEGHCSYLLDPATNILTVLATHDTAGPTAVDTFTRDDTTGEQR